MIGGPRVPPLVPVQGGRGRGPGQSDQGVAKVDVSAQGVGVGSEWTGLPGTSSVKRCVEFVRRSAGQRQVVVTGQCLDLDVVVVDGFPSSLDVESFCEGIYTVCTRPPTRSRASSTTTSHPPARNATAAVSPESPAPTTMTRPGVEGSGRGVVVQPPSTIAAATPVAPNSCLRVSDQGGGTASW